MIGDFTPVDRVQVAHACEDYAGQWYGSPATAGSVGRYVAEGSLGGLCDRYGLSRVAAAVWEHLDAHPEIRAAGRLTDGQRAANKAARDGRAREWSRKSVEAFYAGRWDDALTFIDRAELESPGLEDYEADRRIVREHAAGLPGSAA